MPAIRALQKALSAVHGQLHELCEQNVACLEYLAQEKEWEGSEESDVEVDGDVGANGTVLQLPGTIA